ncbi:MAG: leucine-rich repeat domain-containing protein, partial [Desulfobacterales bacterium]|nr:leucine-rich repeat domain-containing protein [Desulfobacterales bacterium]
KSLTELNLTDCKSLQNVDGLAGLKGLTELDLSDCVSLQNIEILAELPNLTELNLKRCPYIKTTKPIENCSRLKDLSLDREDEAIRILVICAKKRGDIDFIEQNIADWLDTCRSTPDRLFLCEPLAEALSICGDKEWGRNALQSIMQILKDVEMTEAPLAATLATIATLQNTPAMREIAEICLEDGDGCSEDAAIIRIRSYLCTLPDYPESARDWSLDIAAKLLKPVQDDPSLLDDVAPSIVLFYARMNEEGQIDDWLTRITARPDMPGAGDVALFQLSRHFLEEETEDRALELGGRITSIKLRDELSAVFSAYFAENHPELAGWHLRDITDTAIKKATALSLLENPEVTAHIPNIYALLMALQGDREAMSKFLGALIEQHPEAGVFNALLSTGVETTGADTLTIALDELVEAKIITESKKEEIFNEIAGELQVKFNRDLRRTALQFLSDVDFVTKRDLKKVLGKEIE